MVSTVCLPNMQHLLTKLQYTNYLCGERLVFTGQGSNMLQKITSLLLITFILVYSCRCALLPLPDEKTSRISLSKCIVEGSARNLKETEMITMSLSSVEVDKERPSATVLDRILLNDLFSKVTWTLVIVRAKKSSLTDLRKTDSYIVQIRRLEEFNVDLKNLQTYKSWNPHAKFVVVSATVFENVTDTVAKIVEHLSEAKVINGIIMFPNPENPLILNIFSWYPYGNNSCGKNFDKSEKIDSCAFGTFQTNTPWFGNEIPKQLNNCTVRIRTVPWPPFVMEPSYHLQGTDLYEFEDGLEIQLFNAISERMNIGVIYSMSEKKYNWGTVLDNGTSTGLFLALEEGRADIVMSSLALQQKRAENLDASKSYIQESLTWCVPHANTQSPFQKLTGTMKLETWCLVIVSFFAFSMAIWSLSCVEKNELSTYKSPENTFQNVLSLALGMAVRVPPKTYVIRVFLFIWIISTMFFDIEYTTYMISTLTSSKYEEQIKTLEDILRYDFNLYINQNSMTYLNGSNRLMRGVLKKWKNCMDMHQCLKEVAYKRNAAVCIPRHYQQHVFNKYKTSTGDPLLYCFEDSVVSYPVVMYMTKGYPFLERIDKLIENVKAAGLIEMWERRIYQERWYNATLEDPDEEGPKWMNISHLEGAFIVLVFGHLLSLLVFFGEIFWHRRSTKQKIIYSP